ncbi:MAG: TssN family type VI secretion system protein [Flavobacteriales bacterium]
MLNGVIISWTVLFLITGLGLMFLLKNKDRKLGKFDMIVKLITVVLAFAISFLAYYFTKGHSNLTVGFTRLGMLLLGSASVVVMYNQTWSIRNKHEFSEDAFGVEFMYVLNMAFLCAIAYLAAPYTFELVPYSEEVAPAFWDAPLVYIIPFLLIKILDFSGQFPLKRVEQPYVFPLEQVNHQDWQWRGMRQVNFALKASLVEEYDLFAWNSRPWIEAPVERKLGEVFHLCIQERRKKSNLSTIQDMGDEYQGTPEFCWLFYVKALWNKPNTWFRKTRCLNPSLTIEQNNISKNDIIVAVRIIGDGSASANLYEGMIEEDSDKTVLINR